MTPTDVGKVSHIGTLGQNDECKKIGHQQLYCLSVLLLLLESLLQTLTALNYHSSPEPGPLQCLPQNPVLPGQPLGWFLKEVILKCVYPLAVHSFKVLVTKSRLIS